MLELTVLIEYLSFFYAKSANLSLFFAAIYLIYNSRKQKIFYKLSLNIYSKIFIVLCIYIFISALISNDIKLGLSESFKFSIITIVGFLLFNLATQLPLPTYSYKTFWSYVIFNILLISENIDNYKISSFLLNSFNFKAIAEPLNRISAFNLMVAPIILDYAKKNEKYYYILAIVISISCLTHPMDAVKLAFITSLTLYILYKIWDKLIFKLYFIALILMLNAIPWFLDCILKDEVIIELILKPSWSHRILIWSETINLIHKNLPFGAGIGASKYISSIIPMHPHNFILQIWLELGMIGVHIITLLLTIIYFEIMKLSNNFIIFASFNIIIVFSMVSFGIWQSWLLSSIWLTVIIYNHLYLDSKSHSKIKNY